MLANTKTKKGKGKEKKRKGKERKKERKKENRGEEREKKGRMKIHPVPTPAISPHYLLPPLSTCPTPTRLLPPSHLPAVATTLVLLPPSSG